MDLQKHQMGQPTLGGGGGPSALSNASVSYHVFCWFFSVLTSVVSLVASPRELKHKVKKSHIIFVATLRNCLAFAEWQEEEEEELRIHI